MKHCVYVQDVYNVKKKDVAMQKKEAANLIRRTRSEAGGA
jgi:hypothetical protein